MPKPAITRVSNLQITPSSTNVEKGFYTAPITTTQRDAITQTDGSIIYNTTTKTFQGHQAGSWTDLATAGGKFTLTAPTFATANAPVPANGNIYYDSNTNALTIGVSNAYVSVYTSPLKQAGNLVMKSLANNPVDGDSTNGEVYYNATDNVVRARVNGVWKNTYTQNSLGFSLPYTLKNDAYTVVVTDVIIGVDTSAKANTISLPPVNTTASGQIFIVKDETSNANNKNITITPNGADTIDNANNSVTIANASGVISLYSSGTAWLTIEKRV